MTAIAQPRHQVAVATARIHDQLDTVAGASVWSMDPVETGATLLELDRAVARAVELRSRVAAQADRVGVGDDVAASSTTTWLAHHTHQTRAAAKRTIALGLDLEEHPLVRDALAAGDLVADQARVIITAVKAIPTDLGPGIAAQAEAHLVSLAGEHDAKALRYLGASILDVVAPEVADTIEQARLEKQERRAEARTWFRCYDDGHGSTHGEFTIPTAIAGATLTKILWAFAAPKHTHATGHAGVPVHQRPTPERLGEAFCELITRYPAKRLPRTGALNATVVVTIDHHTLLGQLQGVGVLDTGHQISAAHARRLACQAGILPAVLDGDSQPLDLGRTKRLHTEAQRTAMLLRDRGCAAEGCDRTTGLHAHHRRHWAHGGDTSVENGVLLCGWHHHRAHDTRYDTTHTPTGKVVFHRRT